MKLSEFIVELAESPDLRSKYVKKPHAVCLQKGLSAGDIDALRTSDQAKIDAALKESGGKGLWIVISGDWIVQTNLDK